MNQTLSHTSLRVTLDCPGYHHSMISVLQALRNLFSHCSCSWRYRKTEAQRERCVIPKKRLEWDLGS